MNWEVVCGLVDCTTHRLTMQETKGLVYQTLSIYLIFLQVWKLNKIVIVVEIHNTPTRLTCLLEPGTVSITPTSSALLLTLGLFSIIVCVNEDAGDIVAGGGQKTTSGSQFSPLPWVLGSCSRPTGFHGKGLYPCSHLSSTRPPPKWTRIIGGTWWHILHPGSFLILRTESSSQKKTEW